MDYSHHKRLEFRRKFFKIFGAAINIFDTDTNQQFGYVEMKAWKLREDIRLYSDNTKSHELLRIHARSIIDFGATYDVYDSATDKLLFSLRRKGLRSTFIRDQWLIFDALEIQVARLQETSSGLALIRRYVGFVPIVGAVADLVLYIAPLTYHIEAMLDGVVSGASARIIHRKNPFIVKIGLDITDVEVPMDPRISIAMTTLLSVIDASKH